MDTVITSEGVRLATRTWGPAEAPLVVLVHGLGLAVESWGRVPELVARDLRVVGYDLRGHGRSAQAPDGDYSLAAHARDLGAVLDQHLEPGARATVVGHSLGGAIVLAHARDAGVARLRAAVFAGSGGSGVTVPGLPARGLPAWAERGIKHGWLQLLRGTARVGRRLRPVEAVSDRLVRRAAFVEDAPQDAVDRVREQFLSTRPRALARTTLASVSHDGVRLAPELDVPTLVLHGREDPEVPEDELRQLLSRLPRADVVELPGLGHMLPLLRPEQVARHITSWAQSPTVDREAVRS